MPISITVNSFAQLLATSVPISITVDSFAQLFHEGTRLEEIDWAAREGLALKYVSANALKPSIATSVPLHV